MKLFLKANVASLTASFFDYLLTIVLKQLFLVDAVIASILGTVFGGIINFLIGRHWVFRAVKTPFFHQGKRYLLTWTGNLILNALGVFVLIRLAGVNYIIAKVVTSITVAVAYNYPIQKKYVFKNIDIDEKD
ncbi:MAG: GtrA family protein [Ferruginibacter sp.]|nr:GtrA family protein [Ferruginibacter sp.]